MNQIRYILLCACALIGTCAQVYAQTLGAACRTAIPMGSDYSAQVKKGQTIWYSAWTFDLPLTVTFAPQSKTDPAPDVEMDFTCTPGYYRDSILCSLFCKTSGGSGIQFDLPHKPSLSSKTLDDGTFVYYLSLGKKYRDLLLQVGISYNVEVFVKVTYKCDGTISLAPDDLFSNCVDNAKFMQFGDTVNVKANDKKRHVIVPYVQWQEDTIIYRWSGAKPCIISVSNTCDFDPIKETGKMIQFETVQPGDSLKVEAKYVYDWVHNEDFPNEAGMYFAKFVSEEPGTITIVKAPQTPPRGEATLLRYDKTYALNAHETGVFAIPTSWNDAKINSKFTTPTEHIFRMTIATDPDFSDTHTLKTYQFDKIESGRWQGITGKEMADFWKKTTEQFLYIRFDCSEATTVTPEKWYMSDCYEKTAANVVNAGDNITVTKSSTTVYRFSYPQWAGGDMTVSFALNSACEVYFADTCAINRSKADASYWLVYKNSTKSTLPLTIPASEIASWADRLDEEKCFYGLFYTSANSTNRKLTFTTDAPEETDPTYPASTIAVACDGTKVVVMVSQPQTIEVYDQSSVKKAEWEADPSTPHELVLPAGKYTLVGEMEKIEINL